MWESKCCNAEVTWDNRMIKTRSDNSGDYYTTVNKTDRPRSYHYCSKCQKKICCNASCGKEATVAQGGMTHTLWYCSEHGTANAGPRTTEHLQSK